MEIIKELSKINDAINHNDIIGAILPKFIQVSPRGGVLVMNKNYFKCILEYIKYMMSVTDISFSDIELYENILSCQIKQEDYDHYIDLLSKSNPSAFQLPYSTMAAIVGNMKMAYNISLFLKGGGIEDKNGVKSNILRVIVFRAIYAMEVILKYQKA
jgi:hypothetical protein